MTEILRLFFFQAEDGIRDLVRSRGLGDVYKRQALDGEKGPGEPGGTGPHVIPEEIEHRFRSSGHPGLSLIHI